MLYCRIRRDLLENEGEGAWPHIQWIDPNKDTIEEKEARIYSERVSREEMRLFVKDLKENDKGTYTCEVSCGSNPIRIYKVINIHSEINFQNTRNDFEEKINKPIFLPCKATGNPEPEITWKFKKKIIVTNEKFEVTKYGLKILNLKPINNGTYVCEASVLSYGDSMTKKINLNVLYPPIVKKPLKSPLVSLNSKVTLECEAHSNPPPIFQWFKGNPVTGKRLRSSKSGIFIISRVSMEDRGVYTCLVINKEGQETNYLNLDIAIPPKINMMQTPREAVEGKRLNISCFSSGFPRVQINWTNFRGEKLQNNNRLHIIQSEDGRASHLLINQVSKNDQGSYSCTSKNKVGSDAKSLFVDVFYSATVVPKSERILYAWSKKKRSFTCGVEGKPLPKIYWLRQGMKLDSFPNQTISIQKMSSTSYTTTLQLTLVNGEDDSVFNTYTCVAKNIHGHDKKNFELKLATVPDHPKSVKVSNITFTSFQLRATAPFSPMDIILDKVMEVGELEWNTEYVVLVSTKNEVGESESTKFNVKTLSPNPPVHEEIPQSDEYRTENSFIKNQKFAREDEKIKFRRKTPTLWSGVSVVLIVMISGLLTVLTTVGTSLALRNWRNRPPSTPIPFRPVIQPLTTADISEPFPQKNQFFPDNRYKTLPKKLILSNECPEENIKKSWPLSSTLPRSLKMNIHMNKTASILPMMSTSQSKQGKAWKEMMNAVTEEKEEEDEILFKPQRSINLNRNKSEADMDQLPAPPEEFLFNKSKCPHFHSPGMNQVAFEPILQDHDAMSFIDDEEKINNKEEEEDDVVITDHYLNHHSNNNTLNYKENLNFNKNNINNSKNCFQSSYLNRNGNGNGIFYPFHNNY